MGNIIKNIVSFAFRICFSAALLGYIFSKIDIPQTFDVLRSAHMGFMTYAAIIFLAINILLLWRWIIFIKAMSLSASLRDIVHYYFIGLFGNLFLPTAIGGDFIKIYGLCKNSTQKTKVVASVLLDRLSGFAAIILVALGAFFLGYRLLGDNAIPFLIPMAGIAVISVGFVSILFHERLYSFCCRIFNAFPKIKEGLMSLHYDMALMKGKQVEGLKAVAVSCVTQTIYAVAWYWIARALDQDIGIVYFFIFVPLTCIAASFPSIGGLGVREMGTVYLFGKVGMDAGIAASLSLINFLFMVVFGFVGGIVYVFTLSSGRLQYYSQDAPVRPGEA